MPSTSYIMVWARLKEELYPDKGWQADIYTGELDYDHLAALENMTASLEALKNEGLYIKSFDNWWSELKIYSRDKKNITHWQDFASEEDFQKLMSDFLFSSYGSKFKQNFKFEGDLTCNKAAPKIKFSKLEFEFLYFYGTGKNLPAMWAVEKLVKDSGVPGAFTFSKAYQTWETDAITAQQLQQNIGLAMACIFIVSLVMLASIPVCFIILFAVSLTLIDIIGFLHFWDINIDFIVCTYTVLSIGLCVDYAVHIGQAFLVQTGSKHEKALGAVSSIGPAVLNGGITTFLALFLTCFSQSYIFVSFFKVFFLTVVFGLFHGLVLLPVILAMAGPADDHVGEEEDKNEKTESNGQNNPGFL